AVFDSYGADAMRWYLLSSSILRGADFSVTEAGIRETVRQVLLPFWNAWYFLGLYANAEGVHGRTRTTSDHVLDRYILAKTGELVEKTTRDLDTYDLFAATGGVRDFLDVLTNWYIRRSRDRFWRGDRDAIDTLHTVLEILCKVSAPLLPMVSEKIYGGLTASGGSVHLADWPTTENLPADPELVRSMDRVREVCSLGLSIRKANSRRVRLPLSELKVAHEDAESLRSFVELIADEVNVKSVTLKTDLGSAAETVLQVIPGALGPRLGGRTQEVIKAVKVGDWSRDGDRVTAGGIELLPGEYSLKMASSDDGSSLAMADGQGMVSLDLEVTPALEAEGRARDLIRLVQQSRRDTGLDVSDRIVLVLGVPEFIRRSLQPFLEMVAAETLATSIEWGAGDLNAQLDDDEIHIGVSKAK
ncbi:MAG: isoleucyl-tRNA synthetase, partial [Actinomycetota bacterium]